MAERIVDIACSKCEYECVAISLLAAVFEVDGGVVRRWRPLWRTRGLTADSVRRRACILVYAATVNGYMELMPAANGNGYMKYD